MLSSRRVRTNLDAPTVRSILDATEAWSTLFVILPESKSTAKYNS